MKHKLLKNKKIKKGTTTMQLSTSQTVENVTTNELVTWARVLSSDDLKSFINYRSNALGDLDDDDFELAGL